MTQQSMADYVYGRLDAGPVAAAQIVRELRCQWGIDHGVSSIHGFVREVVTCLLHRDDVEIGDLIDGRFVGWQLPPWDADQRVDSELMSTSVFLDDETRYLFRKKPVD